MPTSAPGNSERGFTLVEVLVALTHPRHVEQDDELAVHLAHAGDEVRANLGTKARRRFDIRLGNFQDFRHRIDHHADILLDIAFGHFDDDDAGPPRHAGRFATKTAGQIYDRHHGAA